MKISPTWIAAFVLTGFTAGCSSTGTSTDNMQSASLYPRLGEKPAITAVVDDFVARVAADSRINARFASANIPRLKMNPADQTCAASGGRCAYRGPDSRTAHAGVGLSTA